MEEEEGGKGCWGKVAKRVLKYVQKPIITWTVQIKKRFKLTCL